MTANPPPAPRPGPRDDLLTEALDRTLVPLGDRARRRDLEPVDAPRRLASHVADILVRELRSLPANTDAATQAAIINRVLRALPSFADDPSDRVRTPVEILEAIAPAHTGPGAPPSPELTPPTIPLSASDLLVNGAGQPNIGSELRHELRSADRVDLLCAFVIWSGVVRLRDALRSVIERGGEVRVITTTYMGATERRAVEALTELGASVKVAFDARTTKLHAKAWLLERDSGLTTAFVGSSNLSHTALFDGLEWNVRLAAREAPHLIERIRTTFETYWASPHFERYNPDVDAERLDRTLGLHRKGPTDVIDTTGLEVRPYPHQERILEQLRVERERHDRHRNLVVAATGTGKTVLAALDYRAIWRASGDGSPPSLLFVAHREQILKQARHTFRAVLGDGAFGEVHAGGRRATGRHVFAMIQSLSTDELAAMPREAFSVVIVDEFHHAAATSYRRLLEHVQPAELVGLTATPERLDGADVTAWFGGHVSVDLRLWEAIDEGLLVPFQYFGVSDDTNLEHLTWTRAGYRASELDGVYTGNDARVRKLLEAIGRVVPHPRRMRALGFCVSVEHARYMSERFTAAGLPSEAIDGTTPPADRDDVLRRLRDRELCSVFSVEVLGEGVDVPDVDTILLLRPTDSATVFIQQLGRGLRRAEDKASVTVIDLIGQQHRSFRFDRRLEGLIDRRRGPLADQVEREFPFLPSGCHVELDRVARETVLTSLREVARLRRRPVMAADLRALGNVDLGTFLAETGRNVEDIYRQERDSWTALRQEAGLSVPTLADGEVAALRAARRLLHVDDPSRAAWYREILVQDEPPALAALDDRRRRQAAMLLLGIFGRRPDPRFASLDEALERCWSFRALRTELVELLDVLDAGSTTVTRPSPLAATIPLELHARYTRDELLAAFGAGSPERPPTSREGVIHLKDEAVDLFFVTLRKTERSYSPTTMYRDHAVSRELFHWESQSGQSDTSPSVRRYREHRARGSQVVLAVRETNEDERGVAMPFMFLGPVDYVSDTGSRPVAFTWRLRTPMPVALFDVARVVAA